MSGGAAQFAMQADMISAARAAVPGGHSSRAWRCPGACRTSTGSAAPSPCPPTRASRRRKTPRSWPSSAIPQIHATGGLVGTTTRTGTAALAACPQAAGQMLTADRGALLRTACWAVTCIEVGYNVRQGVGVAHHVALWDILSRNAMFLTGNGDQRRPLRHGLATASATTCSPRHGPRAPPRRTCWRRSPPGRHGAGPCRSSAPAPAEPGRGRHLPDGVGQPVLAAAAAGRRDRHLDTRGRVAWRS